LMEKYARIEAAEVRFEGVELEDAELVVVAFGIVSRVVRSAMETLRPRGVKVGLLRPQTLWPFPEKALAALARESRVRGFLCVEMSDGQMVKDVKLSVLGAKPVTYYGRMGGHIPTEVELVEEIQRRLAVPKGEGR